MFMTTDQLKKDEVELEGAYFVGNLIGAGECRGAWVFADTAPNRGKWVPTYLNFDAVACIRYEYVVMLNGETFYLHPKSMEYVRVHSGYFMLRKDV